MTARDNNAPSMSDDGWIRLKLMQMSHDGIKINPNLIPLLAHDDILQLRPIGSQESICIQYKKSMAIDIRSKDRSISICSRVFQNRKDIFPQRGDVEVRRVDKESVRILLTRDILN